MNDKNSNDSNKRKIYRHFNAEFSAAKGDKLASFLIQFGPIVSIDSSDKSQSFFQDTNQGRNLKRVKNGINIYLLSGSFLASRSRLACVWNRKGKRGRLYRYCGEWLRSRGLKGIDRSTHRKFMPTFQRFYSQTCHILYFYYSLQPRTRQPSALNRLRIPLPDNVVFQKYSNLTSRNETQVQRSILV